MSCDNTFLKPHLDQPRSATHYLVNKAAEVHQYMQETNTAFHAGNVVATWSLIKSPQPGKYINPNFYTIGIQREGFPDDEWPDAQYQASHALIDEIRPVATRPV